MTDDELRGWKEIATFLGTSRRSAQRWEAEFGLPVHRLGGQRGTVYAVKAELVLWRETKTRQALGDEDLPQDADAESGELGDSGEGEEQQAGGSEPLPESCVGDQPGTNAAPPSHVVPTEPAGVLGNGAHLAFWARAVTWRSVSILLVVVLVVVATWAFRSVTDRPSETTVVPAILPPDQMVFLRVTARGIPMTLAIPNGGRARLQLGSLKLQLVPLRDADGVHVQVGEIHESPSRKASEVVLMARLDLRPNHPFTIRGQSDIEVEWLPVAPVTPRPSAPRP